jgi:hypothetical protein
MTKRIYAIIFLFFCGVMYIHAFGKSEARYRRELEQYPITVAPISLRGGVVQSYTFIDAERLIMIETLQLTEINLSTGEQKKIEIPEEWAERGSGFFLRKPQYDKENNSIHINLVNSITSTYHILHLDDYTWETIEELGNGIIGFYYDTVNTLIYVNHAIRYETDSAFNYSKTYITTYDLQRREVIDRVELPEDTDYVYSIYGNPPKILALAYNQISKRSYFFIYDLITRTRIDYPESDIFYGSNSPSYLEECISVGEERSFLCVESNRNSSIRSSIALVDFNTNTLERVGLVNFPYGIYNFQQIAEGKYSFLVVTRTWAGGYGPKFLCFLDYP